VYTLFYRTCDKEPSTTTSVVVASQSATKMNELEESPAKFLGSLSIDDTQGGGHAARSQNVQWDSSFMTHVILASGHAPKCARNAT
jgi:hypothetical protein